MRLLRGPSYLLLVLPLLGLLFAAPTARGQAPDAVQATSLESAEFLVGLVPGRVASVTAALPTGAEITGRLDAINVVVVRAPQTAPPFSLSLPTAAVLWIEPNGLVHAAEEVVPNDDFYESRQWALQKIGLPAAWGIVRGMAAPLAIIDSGIDLDHPDLASRIWRNPGEVAGNGLDDDGNGYVDDVAGWDFVGGDPIPDDRFYHGTHVAGIAGAATNNGRGIAGVTWETPLMAVRVLDQYGDGWWDDVAAGILYAVDNGARVLNLSLGGGLPSQTLTRAVAHARARGCLIVAAAGNNGGDVLFPARLEGVIAVGATDVDDAVWPNSSRGPELDLVAPGVAILSTVPGNRYLEVSGTSMATPHVSGVAALILGRVPTLSANELAALLRQTAVDLAPPGPDSASGWGRVDAGRAISAAHPYRYYFPVISP